MSYEESETFETKAITKAEAKRTSPLGDARTTDDLPLGDAVRALMASGLVKSTEDAGKLMTKLNFGRSMDLRDIVSVNGIQIGPNQTIIMSAQLMSALIGRSAKYRKVVKQRDLKGAAIEIFERDGDQWIPCGVPITFGPEDAKRAGLENKESYKRWPIDMYYNRALAAAFRVYCSDCCAAQVYIPEEIPNSGYRTASASGDIAPEEPEVAVVTKATPKATPPPKSPGLEAEVGQLLKTSGADEAAFFKHFNTKKLADFTTEQLLAARELLLKRMKATPKGVGS